jgi:hypothetical protein
VHIGEPSLFRFWKLDKINASLILLLFKLFVKFDIAYSPSSPRGDICVLSAMLHALLMRHGVDNLKHRPVGKPKRKV